VVFEKSSLAPQERNSAAAQPIRMKGLAFMRSSLFPLLLSGVGGLGALKEGAWRSFSVAGFRGSGDFGHRKPARIQQGWRAR